jgi:aspartyl-tRNA(Asn)/glutamyl-tRNA(Gln) amidotransferase subunit C
MSITTEEVKKLASLSRIAVSDEEVESLRKDMDSILAYVEEINSAPLADIEVNHDRVNVFRGDDEANAVGEYREKLLANAPDRDGNYLKVKKIL